MNGFIWLRSVAPLGIAAWNSLDAVAHLFQKGNPRLHKTVEKIRFWTLPVNGAIILYQGIASIGPFLTNDVCRILLEHPDILATVIFPAIMTTIIVTILATQALLNRIYRPKENLRELLAKCDSKNLELRWQKSAAQRRQQIVYVTQLVTGVALLFLSSHPISLAIGAIALAYSLHQTFSRKYVSIGKVLRLQNKDQSLMIAISYLISHPLNNSVKKVVEKINAIQPEHFRIQFTSSEVMLGETHNSYSVWVAKQALPQNDAGRYELLVQTFNEKYGNKNSLVSSTKVVNILPKSEDLYNRPKVINCDKRPKRDFFGHPIGYRSSNAPKAGNPTLDIV